MKKKKATVFLAMLVSAGLCLTSTVVRGNVAARADSYEMSGVGFSVNIVKGSYGSLLTGSSVLDCGYMRDTLESLLVKKDCDRYFYTEQSYETYKDFAINFKERIRILEGQIYDPSVYPFLSDLSETFATNLEAETLYGAYYYEWFLQRGVYTLSLPETDNFAQTYAGHYNRYFLQDLDKLKAGEETYDDFFVRHGTHFIAGLEYGGRIWGIRGEFSDKASFDGNDKTKFLKKYQNYAQSAIIGNSSFKFNKLQIKQNNSVLYEQGIEAWLDSLDEEHASIIGYGGKLIPIYEVLPVEYVDMRDVMLAAFRNYADQNVNLYENAVKQKPVEPPIDPDVQESPASEVDWKRVALYSVAGGIVVAGIVIGAAAIVRKKKKS